MLASESPEALDCKKTDNHIFGMFDPDEDELEQDELVHQIMGMAGQHEANPKNTRIIKVRAMVDSGAFVSACLTEIA